MWCTNIAVLISIVQVSFGDMIACDNENVSPFFLLAYTVINDRTLTLIWLRSHGGCYQLHPLSTFDGRSYDNLSLFYFDSVKEVNGFIILVWGSHQKQGSEGSGIVQLVGSYHNDCVYWVLVVSSSIGTVCLCLLLPSIRTAKRKQEGIQVGNPLLRYALR